MSNQTISARSEANSPWEIEFDYIESCNCLISCPCPFTGAPTFGHCHLLMAFHIIDGAHDATSLRGLNAVMVNDVPGNMRGGGYSTAVYIDERGDSAQRAAVEAIFTGKLGGVFAGFAALTVKWLGVKHASIEISTQSSAVSIPQVLSVAYEPIIGIGGGNAALVDTGQRIALGKRLNVGKSTVSRFSDFGVGWDNAGCNVFWGRFFHSRKVGS